VWACWLSNIEANLASNSFCLILIAIIRINILADNVCCKQSTHFC
jgi:hypothetical protein